MPDAFENYVTQEGDMVDLIAYRRFGTCQPAPAILDANPQLAAYGPVLPRGVTVRIPVPIVADRSTSKRLWS